VVEGPGREEDAAGEWEERRTGDHPTFVSVEAVPSLGLRELKLLWPGERMVEILDLPGAWAEGWVPVAWVWHGARGSWREPWPG
jgi:hypothetical protein